MKTNVTLFRKLDQFDVLQRTSDGMFNASSLIQQWNHKTGEQKEIKSFFRNDNTKAFINALIADIKGDGENLPYLKTRASQGFSNGENLPHLKTRARQGFCEVLKTARGNGGATWMHPLLFIKFAMWLNPSFEVRVLKFVYDELIKDRHLCGDNYKKLSASISKFPDVNYPEIATALNWIVFNKHYPEIRNKATIEQMKDLHEVEQQLAYAVDMNLITSYPQLLNVMRETYNRRYPKF